MALAHVAELLDEGAVALLCFERDHTTCHRHLVVSELQRATPELQVISFNQNRLGLGVPDTGVIDARAR